MFKTIRKELYRSWWVCLFSLFCYGIYEQSMRWKNEHLSSLSHKKKLLQAQKAAALHEQYWLRLEAESQDDPATIELALIQELGLIPENSKKILFD